MVNSLIFHKSLLYKIVSSSAFKSVLTSCSIAESLKEIKEIIDEEKISDDEFKEKIADNTFLETVNKVKVKKGDVFFIEAGTLHAIGKGILLAEIQQNSNTTYRVSDYGRLGADGKPRPLHIETAKASIERPTARIKSSSKPKHNTPKKLY
mgnify:CR=1 FL=1